MCFAEIHIDRRNAKRHTKQRDKDDNEDLARRLYQFQMDMRAIRNSKASPLLRLPGELRNEIYGYLIGGHEFPLLNETTARENNIFTQYTALAQVSRQVRKETMSYFWEHSKFVTTCADLPNAVIHDGDALELLPIRTLQIDIEWEDLIGSYAVTAPWIAEFLRQICEGGVLQCVVLRYKKLEENYQTPSNGEWLEEMTQVASDLSGLLPCMTNGEAVKVVLEWI
ncbi:hypothetical protein E8E13_003677 [Curvularia kusanoi]|uniref:F-box domain-containing protein n=1 Tax=Curvularia kusanoi TaxID=90978 RepID=A0A9P4TE67_CURKU|nr:hypothetical protein E8E13_003677 [Curvularia kusanoi]